MFLFFYVCLLMTCVFSSLLISIYLFIFVLFCFSGLIVNVFYCPDTPGGRVDVDVRNNTESRDDDDDVTDDDLMDEGSSRPHTVIEDDQSSPTPTMDDFDGMTTDERLTVNTPPTSIEDNHPLMTADEIRQMMIDAHPMGREYEHLVLSPTEEELREMRQRMEMMADEIASSVVNEEVPTSRPLTPATLRVVDDRLEDLHEEVRLHQILNGQYFTPVRCNKIMEELGKILEVVKQISSSIQ